MKKRHLSCAIAFCLASVSVMDAAAQNNGESEASQTPVVYTTRQDHQDMLDQLEITKLRPGRNANATQALPGRAPCLTKVTCF